MGVGINATKEVGNALGTAAVAAGMVQNEANHAIEQGQVAADQAAKAQKTLNKDLSQTRYKEAAVQSTTEKADIAKDELIKTLDDADKFKKEVEADPNYSPEEKKEALALSQATVNAASKKFTSAGIRKIMAQRALENLKDEIEANRDVLSRTQKPIEKGRAWGGGY